MKSWSDALALCQRSDQAHVLVTVISTSGSVPRNSGTKMLVTESAFFDTIGGGNLELHAIEHARKMLANGEVGQCVVKYPLAAMLGQCCGGHAILLFESFALCSQSLWLFGAGHVGHALTKILTELPINLHWVDSRSDQFPSSKDPAIQYHLTECLHDTFEQIHSDATLLIMTHSHDQDYQICELALKQQHRGFIGLIGSKTKAARFRHRLQHAGFTKDAVARIESPTGILEIPGKRPMEVAVSIAGRVIQHYHSKHEASASQSLLSHDDIALLTHQPKDQ